MHHFTGRLSAQSAYFITVCFAMETINRRACSHASSVKQFPDSPKTHVLDGAVRIFQLNRTWQRLPALTDQNRPAAESLESSRIMPSALSALAGFGGILSTECGLTVSAILIEYQRIAPINAAKLSVTNPRPPKKIDVQFTLGI